MPDDALERMTGQASPGFWRQAIARQSERIEVGQQLVLEAFNDGRPVAIEEHQRVMADVHFLLIAVRQILRYLDRLRDLTGDPQLVDADSEVRAAMPHVKDARDILEHLDEYAIGLGRLQLSGQVDVKDPLPKLSYRSSTDSKGELDLRLAERIIPLKATTRATINLSELLTRFGWTTSILTASKGQVAELGLRESRRAYHVCTVPPVSGGPTMAILLVAEGFTRS